jgi:membrane protein DedA with SNARE-associated domain
MVNIQTLVDFFSAYGYAAVFGILILCGFGLPIPEDISLVSGGIISGLGYTNVHVMFGISMAGVLIGDFTMYNLGRKFGDRFLNLRLVKRTLTPERYEKIKCNLDKNGKWVIFAARFMPGLRSPIFVTAGITRFVTPAEFLLIDGSAALISVPAWVYLGFFGANQREVLLKWITHSQFGIVVLIVLIVAAFFIKKYISKMIKKKEECNIE